MEGAEVEPDEPTITELRHDRRLLGIRRDDEEPLVALGSEVGEVLGQLVSPERVANRLDLKPIREARRDAGIRYGMALAWRLVREGDHRQR
jgi:hypothetical protein